MAENETKVVIRIDNTQFLEALQVCSQKVEEFVKNTNSIKLKNPNPIQITVDDSAAQNKIKTIEESLNVLKHQEISVDVENERAISSIKEVKDLLSSNTEQKISVSLSDQEGLSSAKEFADKVRNLTQTKMSSQSASADASNTTNLFNEQNQSGAESFSTKLSKIGSFAVGVYSKVKMVGTAIKDTVAPVLEYSAALEQNTIAFESLLGNTELAKKYLGDLQKVAADTPFDLQGASEAGKKLLSFGFSAKQSLSVLKTVGDASAALNLKNDGIERVTLAMGQMKERGTVTNDDLLQLTKEGIPAYQILADKLGLSAEQMQNIGAAGIDADTAMNALLEGMNDKFSGLATKIADSKQGMLSTIQDNALAIGDFILSPLDSALTDGLGRVRDWTNNVADAIRSGDNQGVLAALFPEEIVPEDFVEKITEIGEDIKNMYDEASALAGQFGDTGKNALDGIIDAALDLVDDFINVSRAIIQVGNDLTYIVRSIVPEGTGNFLTMKSSIEFAVKVLAGFFILKQIISLVDKTKTAYAALRLAVIATSKASQTLILSTVSGMASAVKNVRSLRGAVLLLTTAFKNLTKSNILLFIVSIGVAAFGDTIMGWIDKYLGKNSDDNTNETDKPEVPEDKPETSEDKPPESEQPPGAPTTPAAGGNDSKYYQEQKGDLDDYTKMLEQQRQLKLIQIAQDKEKLDEDHKADPNGDEYAYFAKDAQLAADKAGINLETEKLIREKIENTDFENSQDKKDQLNAADLKISNFANELKGVTKDMEELGRASIDSGAAIYSAAEKFLGMEYHMGGSGDWATGTDCGKLTMDAYAGAGLSLSSRTADGQLAQMEDAGGFFTDRKKLKQGDLVFYDTKYMDVSNDRSALASNNTAYKANHVGVYQGDGKILHAGSSTGVAENINMDFAEIVGFGDYTAVGGSAGQQGVKVTKERASKYVEFIKSLVAQGDKFLKESAEMTGDISTQQIGELQKEYDSTIEKFKNNHMPEKYIKAAENVKTFKIGQAEFSQAQKDIESAYDAASRKQKQAFNDVALGTKSELDVANEAASDYKNSVSDERIKLEGMLKVAKENKWTDFANKISDLLDKIDNNIISFYNASLAALDEKLKNRLALINSDPSLTKLQKQDLTDKANREYLQGAIAAKKQKRNELSDNEDDENKLLVLNNEIAVLENQLNGLGSTLNQVHYASKQAFEDGLLNFLEKGIFECQSLGDAFNNLAITVLQSIQKIYAQAMATDIMNALFPANSKKSNDVNFSYQSQYGLDYGGSSTNSASPLKAGFSYLSQYGLGLFADGGSMNSGQVEGPGTGTSDSILAYVSNLRKFVRVSDGEWVMKQKAVNHYGTNIMNAINQGMIPKKILDVHAKYASGGSLRGMIPSTGMEGAYGLTADIANHVSPKIDVTNRFVGDGFIKSIEPWVKSQVDVGYKRNMVENAKVQSMLMKKTW